MTYFVRPFVLALLASITAPTLAVSQTACRCLTCFLTPAENFWITAGAMKPTFEPDDCVFTRADIARVPGDVVIFWHPHLDRIIFVSRLIATGGQVVALRDGILFIDDAAVPRIPAPDYIQIMQREGRQQTLPVCPTPTELGDTCAIPRYTETLGTRRFDVLDTRSTAADTFGPVTVPPGHIFVLGDHRDNAVDSRFASDSGQLAFIPLDNIIGVELRGTP